MGVGLSANTFTHSQKSTMNEAYGIGKQIEANDGMTFGKTLRSIAFSESSAGVYKVGDNGDALGAYQIHLPTAKEVIKKDKFMNKYFSHLLKDDKKLKEMLKNKSEFGALVAGTYIKSNYNKALKKGYKDPYFYAVSKYNGGARNFTYVKKIRQNIEFIKKEL